MQTDPSILKGMENQAVDLNKAMEERAAEQAAKEAKATAAAQAYARDWERQMCRIFKGIFPSTSRRYFMRAHTAKLEREQEAA